MKLVKRAGGPAWQQRPRKMHGSSATWGKMRAAGTMRRLGEKPAVTRRWWGR